MSNQLALSLERLNEMKPTEIVNDEAVKQRFVLIYSRIWTRGDEKEAEAVYEQQRIAFNRILGDSDDLKSCTNFSIFSAFIDLAVCGLSLSQGSCPQCYLLARSSKIGERQGTDGKRYGVYEKRVNLTISGYGELVMRERSGQIRHADNPVIVYANDGFSFRDINGRKEVSYTCNLPHTGQSIVACFMRITRADGSIDYAVLLPEDWQRLAAYSAKQNSYYRDGKRVEGNPNALYTSGNGGCIDTGFLKAKCIKHAFKTYPKVKIGGYTMMEADRTEEEDYYGITDTGVDPDTGELIEDARAPEPQPFGNPDPTPGVTVETDEDEGY